MKGPLDVRRQLVSAGLWSLILRAAGMIATFALGIQLARYLGPTELGIYGLVVAVAMLLSSVGQFGLPTLATREMALAAGRGDHPTLRGIVGWFGLATAVLSLVLGAGFVLVVQLLPGQLSSLQGSAIFGAILVPLLALTVLVSAELRALGRLVIGQSLEILVRPLANCLLLLALFLAAGSMDSGDAVAVNAAASLIALFLGCIWLARSLPAAVRQVEAGRPRPEWVSSASPLAMTDVLRQLDGVYALLMMGMLASSYETGIFRVALSTVLVVAIPLFIVQVVVAPTLARLHDAGDKAELQKLVRLAARVNLAAALFMTLLVGIAGRDLLGFLFGQEYRDSWIPLLILCGGQVVSGFFGVGFVLLPMAHAERELTLCFALSVVIGIACATPLISVAGASGAAAAAVIGSLTNGVAAAYFAGSRFGMRITAVGTF